MMPVGRDRLTICGRILLCLALVPRGPLVAVGQLDCTGVECPELRHCIEETLEVGSCCASCVRLGCECHGYMYYDCLRAGHRRGKVPAGTSYYVDGGSTECKCPPGGGDIDCSFIPCPRLPDNCIRTFQPRDGCLQCAELGCFSSGQRLPAGHTFRTEPCTMCRCLSSGSLTCTTEPGCDPVAPTRRLPAIQKDRPRAPRVKTEGRMPSADGRRDVSDMSLESCCAAGRRWAVEDGKCLRDLSLSGHSELCRELQEQCCLSALEEARCQAGATAAGRGGPCSPACSDQNCGLDVFKHCCECCSLGLRARSLGMACDQIPAPDLGCGQVLTGCCSGTDGLLPATGPRREPRRPQEMASSAETGPGVGWEDRRSSPTEPSWTLEEDRDARCPAGSHCSQLCHREPSAVVCSCYTGYQLMPDGMTCEDINECEQLQQPCTEGFNCVNTIGSYSCHRNIISCSRGYEASEDHARCIDIDECRMGTHHCNNEQICRNTPGSYRCECAQGYHVDPYSRACVDIDECQRYRRRVCTQNCDNTLGSYQCSCRAGYKLAEDGRNCEDVDECEAGACSQQCVNIHGSYQCYCWPGYSLSPLDRTTCQDIDECSLTLTTLCSYRCVNTPGSFSCACPAGYILAQNGRNCKDLDECSLRTHNCTGTEICFNIQGGFRCLTFECPPNYRKVGQNQCERLSCQGYVECQTVPQRITYYQLSFPTNIRVPADIFRISPSPVYVGDNILLGITRGNEGLHFAIRRVDAYTGFVYLQLPPQAPREFLLDVEITLIRRGRATKFIARIHVFVTGPSL